MHRSKDEPVEDPGLALRAEFMLWTIEDVVNAYGSPRAVVTGAGWVTLHYGDFRLEGEDEPCLVEFELTGGFVSNVGTDCPEQEH